MESKCKTVNACREYFYLILITFSPMKTTSVSEIKQELQNLTAKEITELCLRLARYKKENKELLAYLLFEAHDVDAYTERVKKKT